MNIERKWQRYLLGTLGYKDKSQDFFNTITNKIVDDLTILLILGVTSNATLRNYLKSGRLKGKRVADIYHFLVENDEMLVDGLQSHR